MSHAYRMSVARAVAHLSWVENNLDSAARSNDPAMNILVAKFGAVIRARAQLCKALGVTYLPECWCITNKDYSQVASGAPVMREDSACLA